MSYVKLPEDLGGFATRQANGRIASFEFSVFAGETISCECASGRRGKRSGGALPRRLHLRSPKGDKRFEFRGLPSDLVRQGDMAAVIAVLPSNGDHGPIIGVANLDADERIDFRWREGELLRLLTGERRDYRKVGARRRAFALTGLKAAVAGGSAFLAMALYLDPRALETPDRLIRALETAWAPEAMAAAALASIAAAVYFGLSASWRVGRKAAGQRRALEHFWARVGHAFGYAADRREACRPDESVRPSRRAQLSGPLLTPSRLLPAPDEPERQAQRRRQERHEVGYEAAAAATRRAAENALAARQERETRDRQAEARRYEQERMRRLEAEQERREETARTQQRTQERARAEAALERLEARERARREEQMRRDAELRASEQVRAREPVDRAVRALEAATRDWPEPTARRRDREDRLERLRAQRHETERRQAERFKLERQEARGRRGAAEAPDGRVEPELEWGAAEPVRADSEAAGRPRRKGGAPSFFEPGLSPRPAPSPGRSGRRFG